MFNNQLLTTPFIKTERNLGNITVAVHQNINHTQNGSFSLAMGGTLPNQEHFHIKMLKMRLLPHMLSLMLKFDV